MPTKPTLSGWELLHSPLPPEALKPLSESVYGVSGLTDVNEGHLIERLHACGLKWSWDLAPGQPVYLGFESRTPRGKNYSVTFYLASCAGVLNIGDQRFAGVGGSDNKKLDAAYKGANTVAFKAACKLAGLTMELYVQGKARDDRLQDDEETFESRPPPSASAPERESRSTAKVRVEDGNPQLDVLYSLAADLPGKMLWNKAKVNALISTGKSTRELLDMLAAAHVEACGEEDCVHVQAGRTAWDKTGS